MYASANVFQITCIPLHINGFPFVKFIFHSAVKNTCRVEIFCLLYCVRRLMSFKHCTSLLYILVCVRWNLTNNSSCVKCMFCILLICVFGINFILSQPNINYELLSKYMRSMRDKYMSSKRQI